MPGGSRQHGQVAVGVCIGWRIGRIGPRFFAKPCPRPWLWRRLRLSLTLVSYH